MPRNFSSLSPSEVLQAAISIEQRNADIYHRFAEMFTEFGDEESLEIASVFWEMAVEERGHRALLEEKYVRAYGPLSATFTEHELCELVEVPTLETADIFGSSSEASARDARSAGGCAGGDQCSTLLRRARRADSQRTSEAHFRRACANGG